MSVLMNETTVLGGKFISDGKEINGPSWGMSLRKAGSMRFRWNEINPNRSAFLEELAKDSEGTQSYKICQVELTHSKTVYAVNSPEDTLYKTGDGIITKNKSLIPVVTVADCMPLFLYDRVREVFGIVHSGWKGTGIAVEAISLAREVYGSAPEDFIVVMGPHIHSCCYNVDNDRAAYFRENFTPDCIGEGNALSLAEANKAVLLKAGVLLENIFISEDCTCCNDRFGSFRRENPSSETFTVQVAWIKW